VLLLVSASLYGAAIFSYLYLWTVAPQTWPAPEALPSLAWPALSGALALASSGAVAFAGRRLQARWIFGLAICTGLVLLLAAIGVEFIAQRDNAPSHSGYGAAVWLLLVLAGWFGVVVLATSLNALARSFAGRLDPVRRASFDTARLFWHYTVAQTLVGIALVHGFPRLVGAP
jgi:heme/copper-type cytochrome/quinol oxidase subunit 3